MSNPPNYVERMMDFRYSRYLRLRKQTNSRRIKAVRQQRLLAMESSPLEDTSEEVAKEPGKVLQGVLQAYSLESLNKMLNGGDMQIREELMHHVDQLCEMLCSCSFNEWQHLVEILTSLLEKMEQNAARDLVLQSHSMVIMGGMSYSSNKAMFRVEIIDIVLGYCRVACLHLDCIGKTEMSALCVFLKDRLVAFNSQYDSVEELGICLDTLIEIFSRSDDVTFQKDDRQLLRKLEIKILKNICLKECLVDDKRTLLTLVKLIPISDEVVALLLFVSGVLQSENYMKMFVTEFAMQQPLCDLIGRNSQASTHTKRYAIRLINNLIQLSLKIFLQQSTLPLMRYLSTEICIDSTELSYEIVETIANLLCCAQLPITFHTFHQNQGLNLFEYVLSNSDTAPNESVCSVLEACTTILNRQALLPSHQQQFRRLVILASNIYHKSHQPKITELSNGLLEVALRYSELR